MCVAVIAYKYVTDYPLVIVSNRDEFHSRETARAGFWDDAPSILGGRDMEKGGTWLGASTDGRLALVTNYREIDHTVYDRSRGLLASRFLESSDRAEEFAGIAYGEGNEYAGFNLILFDGSTLSYISNRSNEIIKPGQGLYGLSNHLFDTPWPKVQRSKAVVTNQLTETDAGFDNLIESMRDMRIAPDDELPSTGVPLDLERRLSPVFISGEKYGTRCTTVVAFRNDGHIFFTEQAYQPNGITAGRNTFIHQVS